MDRRGHTKVWQAKHYLEFSTLCTKVNPQSDSNTTVNAMILWNDQQTESFYI
jgi:hypothetical protein